MSAKTIYTCDHCGTNVSPYVGEQWRTVLFTTGPNMPDLHACSKEHMGLALAKACGINIEVQTPANSCTDADRTQYEITIEQQKGRIAELEKQLATLNDWAVICGGKTPGQVDYEGYTAARFGACADSFTPWHRLGDDFQRFNEAGAQSVLRVHGRVMAKQATADVLRRVRERIRGNLEGDAAEYAISIIDAELASLEIPKPTADHLHDLGSCSFCDKQGAAKPPSITIPTKPTKPLVLTPNCTICGCSNERAFLELCRGDAKHNFEVTQ